MFSCDNKKNKTKNRRKSGDFGRNFWEYGYFVLVFFCIFGSIVFPSGILIFQIWKCSPVFCVIFFRPDFQLEIGSILFRECHTIPQLVIYVGYCLAANTKISAICACTNVPANNVRYPEDMYTRVNTHEQMASNIDMSIFVSGFCAR